MISILHPSRGRPEKSVLCLKNWFDGVLANDVEWIVSLDRNDTELDKYKELYKLYYGRHVTLIINDNRSAVDAINNAAKKSTGDILIVVSDDTEPCKFWADEINKHYRGRVDWILKTQDGIQPYIITMPVMDRVYYNRTGYIYYPTFDHMFCDTYLTCVADITGRKITSNLLFPHKNDSIKDDLRKRTDSTWKQGEDLFIKLMKEFSPEERARITDSGMKSWLRNKGVR